MIRVSVFVEELLNLIGKEEVHCAFVADSGESQTAEVELLSGVFRGRRLFRQSDYLFGEGTQSLGITEGCLNSIVAEKSRRKRSHNGLAVLFFHAQLVSVFEVTHL